MNRRDLIKAAPVALVGCALPVQAETETPVAALFREWKVAKDAENAVYASTDDEAAHLRAWDHRYAIERRLMDAPSMTPLDWAIKICAWCNFGDGVCEDGRENPQLWAEARALVRVGNLIC